MRDQARLVLSQAEQRSERMIRRANEKVEMLTGPVKEECEKICGDMEATMHRFANFYHDLGQSTGEEE